MSVRGFVVVFMAILVALLVVAAQLAYHPSNHRNRPNYLTLTPISAWTVATDDEMDNERLQDDTTDDKYISLFPNHPDHPDYKGPK